MPTCAASLAGTIEIPAGPFIFGGAGDPPVPPAEHEAEPPPEQRIVLPAFRVDRTEVTNAQFAPFLALSAITGLRVSSYPEAKGFEHAGEPAFPRGGIAWGQARAFCRFMGKQLPSVQQWQRVLRGGERLPDGAPNPMPRRSVPWGAPISPVPANIADTPPGIPVPVGSFPRDCSPEGVLDLAGSLMEWTRTQRGTGRVTCGGDFGGTSSRDLIGYVALPNQRDPHYASFIMGARCVYEGLGPEPEADPQAARARGDR